MPIFEGTPWRSHLENLTIDEKIISTYNKVAK